mmetsp:Transcript_37829/g.103172  ORF Transcript_37829/g.103172 Transcript_37829/m.103172 type:complete len:266 (+) Transcript_37829:271-1068(+)
MEAALRKQAEEAEAQKKAEEEAAKAEKDAKKKKFGFSFKKKKVAEKGSSAADGDSDDKNEPDPLSGMPSRSKWGIGAMIDKRREKAHREMIEKEKHNLDYFDRKNRESELQMMETEEKLSWDAYELPARNRSRMIREYEEALVKRRDDNRKQAVEDSFNQEEGFTFFNGFVKGFSRWRDSPALYISYTGHKGPVYSFQVSSDLNYILSASEDTLLKLWDTHTGRRPPWFGKRRVGAGRASRTQLLCGMALYIRQIFSTLLASAFL